MIQSSYSLVGALEHLDGLMTGHLQYVSNGDIAVLL